MNLLAQTGQKFGKPLSGIGKIGLENGGDPVAILARILSVTVGVLTVVAAIYFMFNLITGIIGVISAGGDKGTIEDAKRKVTTGFIGLVAVIAAMFIMDIIAKVLGIPTILDLQAMIDAIVK